jgi:hypothetical protein
VTRALREMRSRRRCRQLLPSAAMPSGPTSLQRYKLHLKANFETSFSLHRFNQNRGAFKLYGSTEFNLFSPTLWCMLRSSSSSRGVAVQVDPFESKI